MLLLAQEESRPLFEFTVAPLWSENGVPLAVMGILVVFSALLLVAVCIAVLPRALNRLLPASKPGAVADPSQQVGSTPPPVVADDELPEETLVVIAAAVAAALDRPHRIVRIRGWGPSEQAWSVGGRLKHHHSHRIQPRDRQ